MTLLDLADASTVANAPEQPEQPDSQPPTRWQALRPYVAFAFVALLTVAAIYGLVVLLPAIAGASAPGGCGGG